MRRPPLAGTVSTCVAGRLFRCVRRTPIARLRAIVPACLVRRAGRERGHLAGRANLRGGGGCDWLCGGVCALLALRWPGHYCQHLTRQKSRRPSADRSRSQATHRWSRCRCCQRPRLGLPLRCRLRARPAPHHWLSPGQLVPMAKVVLLALTVVAAAQLSVLVAALLAACRLSELRMSQKSRIPASRPRLRPCRCPSR